MDPNPGLLLTTRHHWAGGGVPHHPPTPCPSKDWAKFSSGPSADQKFSLVPLAPPRTQHLRGGGGGQRRMDGKNSQTTPTTTSTTSIRQLLGAADAQRHTMPHPAQPQHTNYWAPRTRKRHQQEHRPQRPTKSSNPTQHAKGRTGDCPGPRKGATTRRNVTQGGGVLFKKSPAQISGSIALACPVLADNNHDDIFY